MITLPEWEDERKIILEKLNHTIEPMPERPPLGPQIIWQREYSTHTEWKITYQGELGECIPAYLLIPRDAPNEYLPAVLALHQCAWLCDIGKEQVVGKCVDLPDQAYGLELVRAGFIVLAPDANKVGERFDQSLRKPWQTAVHIGGQQACCTADSGSWGSIRYKPVYDVMRAVDFLAQHPRVDSRCIGMMGHSLGADTILWSLPFEERIRAVVISGGGIMAATWEPYGIPYADLLRFIAPRPFLEVTGTEDGINWLERERPEQIDERMMSKRAAHSAGRAIYRLYDCEERLACIEFEGGHRFPEYGRKVGIDWLKRWLIPG